MKFTLCLLLSVVSAHSAIVFTNQASAYIRIPANNGAGPMITNGITISAWIMRQVDRGSSRAGILSKGLTEPGPATARCYELSILTNFFNFRYSDPAGTEHVYATSAPGTNVSVHVLMTYTYGSSSSMKFYLDGVLVSGGWTAGTGNNPGTNNNNAIQIAEVGGGTPFMGLIDEVAVWSSVLTSVEITALATSRIKYLPRQISQSTLEIYFPLDGYPDFRGPISDSVVIWDFGPYNRHGSREVSGALAWWPEPFSSYPPNE